MSRGRRMPRKNGDKELDQLQRYKHENDKLKRENSRLRKLIQRGQADQALLHELVQQKNHEEELAITQKREENQWRCWDCSTGILKIHTMPRRDGVFYWRICSNPDCKKHTKLQPYTKDVKGPHHENSDE